MIDHKLFSNTVGSLARAHECMPRITTPSNTMQLKPHYRAMLTNFFATNPALISALRFDRDLFVEKQGEAAIHLNEFQQKEAVNKILNSEFSVIPSWIEASDEYTKFTREALLLNVLGELRYPIFTEKDFPYLDDILAGKMTGEEVRPEMRHYYEPIDRSLEELRLIAEEVAVSLEYDASRLLDSIAKANECTVETKGLLHLLSVTPFPRKELASFIASTENLTMTGESTSILMLKAKDMEGLKLADGSEVRDWMAVRELLDRYMDTTIENLEIRRFLIEGTIPTKVESLALILDWRLAKDPTNSIVNTL